MKNIKKEITFFYNEGFEKIHWNAVKTEADNRGYLTTFSGNMNKKAEIGFYCSDYNKPENSKLSVAMLHGMDQGRNRWPNIWRDWPWHKFDIGLLPGKTWSDRWKSIAQDPYAHPKIAVCEVGSPKADEIFKEYRKFQQKVKKILLGLDLPYDRTVLYAPSFETDNKQKDIMKLLSGTKTNLLIKHRLITDRDKNREPDIWENIKKAHNELSDDQSHIRILSPEESIMTCLGLCDVLVTDESSVAYEALLFNKRAFTFNDWVMRTNNTEEARPVNPPSGIVSVVTKENFREFICNYSKKTNLFTESKKRNEVFSHIGHSSEKIIDIIDSILEEGKIEDIVISNKKVQTWMIPIRFFGKKISKILPKTFRLHVRSKLKNVKFMRSYFGSAN